jgi:sulfur relay protein TusB/DsrH
MTQNLILFGYSGFDTTQLKNLSDLTSGLSDCGVVLMEDAVIGTSTTGNNSYDAFIKGGVKLYCLEEDFNARGLETGTLVPGIESITYSTLIDIIENSPRVISWL